LKGSKFVGGKKMLGSKFAGGQHLFKHFHGSTILGVTICQAQHNFEIFWVRNFFGSKWEGDLGFLRAQTREQEPPLVCATILFVLICPGY
jgi:hypothetical protein